MQKKNRLNYYFIVNPASGRGRGRVIGKKLKSLIDEMKLDAILHFTKAPGHAIEIADRACEQFACVVAVGGDGTLNEVVNGVAENNAKLGLLPVGSGNDFAHVLNIPHNIEHSLHRLLNGQNRRIDLGKANGRYFYNGLGIGFDAHVVHASLKVKRLRGNAIYLYSVLRTLLKYRPVPLRMRYNGQTYIRDYL